MGFLEMLLWDNFSETGVGTVMLMVMKQSGQKSAG